MPSANADLGLDSGDAAQSNLDRSDFGAAGAGLDHTPAGPLFIVDLLAAGAGRWV